MQSRAMHEIGGLDFEGREAFRESSHAA
jgi:hypothetical protein